MKKIIYSQKSNFALLRVWQELMEFDNTETGYVELINGIKSWEILISPSYCRDEATITAERFFEDVKGTAFFESEFKDTYVYRGILNEGLPITLSEGLNQIPCSMRRYVGHGPLLRNGKPI